MSERLYGGGLLRFAERVFDRDTVERVIAPSIADLQHECANAGDGPSRFAVCARAYWGVLKAIALCMLREAVTDRHRAGRRLAVHMLGFMVLFLALTLIPQLRWTIDLGTKHGAATAVEASLLWLPSQLILILPAALFFAIVLQHERVDTTRPSLVPTIGAGGGRLHDCSFRADDVRGARREPGVPNRRLRCVHEGVGGARARTSSRSVRDDAADAQRSHRACAQLVPGSTRA